MATVLDIGFLQNFAPIFTFLLIFTVTFGALRTANIFKDRAALDAFLAFLLGIISLFSNIVVKTISRAAPWFVVLIVFTVFLWVVFRTFGYEQEMLIKGTNVRMVAWWLVFLVLAVTLGSLFGVLAEERGGVPGPGQTGVTIESVQSGISAPPKLAPGEEVTTIEGVKTALTTEEPHSQKSEFWNTLFHPNVLGMAMLLLIGMMAALRLSSEKE